MRQGRRTGGAAAVPDPPVRPALGAPRRVPAEPDVAPPEHCAGSVQPFLFGPTRCPGRPFALKRWRVGWAPWCAGTTCASSPIPVRCRRYGPASTFQRLRCIDRRKIHVHAVVINETVVAGVPDGHRGNGDSLVVEPMVGSAVSRIRISRSRRRSSASTSIGCLPSPHLAGNHSGLVVESGLHRRTWVASGLGRGETLLCRRRAWHRARFTGWVSTATGDRERRR
jgi:hypothetical protein